VSFRKSPAGQLIVPGCKICCRPTWLQSKTRNYSLFDFFFKLKFDIGSVRSLFLGIVFSAISS